MFITGTTNYYDHDTSIISTVMLLHVGCVPRVITPGRANIPQKSLFIGEQDDFIVTFNKFEYKPECRDSKDIEYRAMLKGNIPLPEQIVFDSIRREIKVKINNFPGP